ncbi:MAG: hypothetical protein M1838_002654 [Thelocarpon superellum]|nr:MAG: hypothetical protein M1838_002654 [Thelocarpon superellum]
MAPTPREKMAHHGHRADDSISSSPPSTSSTLPHDGHGKAVAGRGDFDEAFLYLDRKDQQHGELDGLYTAALRHRIDWRIVPIMFACYTMQFLDKVLLNYAAVMGLNKDLKLKGNDFSNAATAFFIAYLVAEVPNGFFLQKISAAKWLGANVMLWGIATAATAAAHDYSTLLVGRIFLGIFEAAIAPSLMLISSQWYTKSEQAPRFSFWYCGLGLAQVLGGVCSYGFQMVEHPTFAGWRIMFLAVGLLTVCIGLATLLILPDSPMKASFLSESHKVALLRHVSINQTGIENKQFKPAQLLELVLDPQIWLMTLMTILISISSGVITTYSATLIKNFGFSSPVAALLNMPSGLVSVASTLAVGLGVRRTSHRWAWIIVCCVPGILGGGLMSFAPASNRAALLAGLYLVNAIVATLTVIYQWTVANCAGSTKRVFASALIAGSFSVGNIIGPQTFQAKDAPQYIPAKITVLATQAAAAGVALCLFLYYVYANRCKDRARGTQVGKGLAANPGVECWTNQTDRENVNFRYVY